jgi:ribosomal-protein-alanine N-acetyltransferase
VAEAEEENEHVVGYLVARQMADEGEILNVGVAAKHRRHGVGRSLVSAGLTQLRGRGATQVYLEVRESNVGARALYAEFGFAEVGRRTKYYRRPVEDAILLRAPQIPPAIPAESVPQ